VLEQTEWPPCDGHRGGDLFKLVGTELLVTSPKRFGFGWHDGGSFGLKLAFSTRDDREKVERCAVWREGYGAAFPLPAIASGDTFVSVREHETK